MPSAIAAIPITVQGVDVQRADLSLFLEIAEGLGAGASVRGGDVLVPGLPGRRSRNRIQEVLALELAGWIKAASLSAYRDIVQELNLLFRPSRGPVELSATLEDGTVVTIPARAEFPFSWGDETGATKRVRIGLEATDPPYWRGVEVVDSARAISASPTDFVLANPGTERTHEIVLELVGPITNPADYESDERRLRRAPRLRRRRADGDNRREGVYRSPRCDERYRLDPAFRRATMDAPRAGQ